MEKGYRMQDYHTFRKWIVPEWNRRTFLRIAVTISLSILIFGFVIRPVYLNGASMEPTYHDHSFNFVFLWTYRFREPAVGDVAVLRYSSERTMLLKRIVALSGDTVEFRNGYLYVNGKKREESYVLFRGGVWNLRPRKVGPGHIYVVGDNRSMPIGNHQFGSISKRRLKGTLLF